MELAIVILNYNTRGLLKYCLRGIAKFPPSLPYEIIVVDNGSRDGSAQMVKEEFLSGEKSLLSQKIPVKLRELPKNTGHAKGNNLGIKASIAPFIFLMNTDILFLDNSLDKLCHHLKNNPRLGAVAPQLLNPDKTIQFSAFHFPKFYIPLLRRTTLGKTKWGKRELDNYVLADWDHRSIKEIDWAMSSALLLRRQALEQVGLFDERFFVYMADLDLCRRLKQAGWQIYYLPEAKFIHYYRRESAEVFGLRSLLQLITRIHLKDWFKYLLKWGLAREVREEIKKI